MIYTLFYYLNKGSDILILFLDKEKSIYKLDTNIGESCADGISTVWYDGEFSFFDGEEKEGFRKVFKWDGEKPVIEYVEIQPEPDPEPSQLDRIESNTNAIMEKESSLDVLLGVSE